MSRQIVLRSPTLHRRQSLLQGRSTASSRRFAEVAGGTTVECAAVCCCPCGLVNILVLAIYKVPVGLCRKAIKEKRRKRLIKKGLLPPKTMKRSKCRCGCDDNIELQMHPVVAFENLTEVTVNSEESEKKLMELEKEMWERFYSTGFWRSPSQREAVN